MDHNMQKTHVGVSRWGWGEKVVPVDWESEAEEVRDRGAGF